MGTGIIRYIQLWGVSSPTASPFSFEGMKYTFHGGIVTQFCQTTMGQVSNARWVCWMYLNHLRQQPEVLLEYDAVIRDQLNRGIMEEVHEPGFGEVGKVHYLPHDTVMTKLRIFYEWLFIHWHSPYSEDHGYYPELSNTQKGIIECVSGRKRKYVLRFPWFDDVKKQCPEVIVLRLPVLYLEYHRTRFCSMPLWNTIWKDIKRRPLSLFGLS